ncbi:MAG: Na+/H+ antiporter subunit E [Clostridiales bacterium]|nr:Na+/H+ antiporter subunit E [Clostridiales bacterium]
MLIALALFFLWIIFNGKLTLEIVLFGLVIAPALAWFVQRFVTPGLTNKKQMLMLRQLPGYIRYAWLLIKEITLANFAVMRLILTDSDIVVPKLTIHHTSLKTTPARIILADCITLTPGTITVNLNKDEYLVHCLDESLEDGVFHSEFEKRLLLKESQWEERMKH